MFSINGVTTRLPQCIGLSWGGLVGDVDFVHYQMSHYRWCFVILHSWFSICPWFLHCLVVSNLWWHDVECVHLIIVGVL